MGWGAVEELGLLPGLRPQPAWAGAGDGACSAPVSPLSPGAPGSPGQPRMMDSLSEPSRPTSFTSAEKRGVGVRALITGPATCRPSQECLPQGDLVPRLRLVSLVSDEGSAWQ